MAMSYDESHASFEQAQILMNVLASLLLVIGGLVDFVLYLIDGLYGSHTEYSIRAAILLPAVIGFILRKFLQRKKFWAVIVAIEFAMACLLFGFYIAFEAFVSRSTSAMCLVPIFFGGLLIIVAGCLIYHLFRSFRALKEKLIGDAHGFEPVMSQAIKPPPGGSHGSSTQG